MSVTTDNRPNPKLRAAASYPPGYLADLTRLRMANAAINHPGIKVIPHIVTVIGPGHGVGVYQHGMGWVVVMVAGQRSTVWRGLDAAEAEDRYTTQLHKMTNPAPTQPARKVRIPR